MYYVFKYKVAKISVELKGTKMHFRAMKVKFNFIMKTIIYNTPSQYL